MKLKRLGRWFTRPLRHRHSSELPPGVRRQIYNHLVQVMGDEQHAQEMLGLRVRPRLSVVDETRVAILRPSYREDLKVDEQFTAAEQEAREEGGDEDAEAQRERHQHSQQALEEEAERHGQEGQEEEREREQRDEEPDERDREDDSGAGFDQEVRREDSKESDNRNEDPF